MKFDFSIVLTNLAGDPLKESSEPDAKDLTLADICTNVLLDPNTKVKGTEKKKRGDLADRLYKKEVAEIDLDEAKLLKDLIGDFYSPMVVKRTWDILEKPLPEDDSEESEGGTES